MTFNKPTKLTTPVGTAMFVSLGQPSTKFDPNGQYQVKMSMPVENAQELIAQIDKLFDQHVAEVKKENPGKRVRVNEPYFIDEEANRLVINTKMRAKLTRKDGSVVDMRPAIYDSELKPIKGDPKAGSGTKLRVSFDVIPYFTAGVGAGLSFRLCAAQIIELVTWGGGSAGAEGFGFAKEDGFKASDLPQEEEEEAKHVMEAVSDDGDF